MELTETGYEVFVTLINTYRSEYSQKTDRCAIIGNMSFITRGKEYYSLMNIAICDNASYIINSKLDKSKEMKIML